jgi:hypothetical protein
MRRLAPDNATQRHITIVAAFDADGSAWREQPCGSPPDLECARNRQPVMSDLRLGQCGHRALHQLFSDILIEARFNDQNMRLDLRTSHQSAPS